MFGSNGQHDQEPTLSLREIDALVRQQLTEIGKAQWGSTLVLWSKFRLKGYLYDNGGYWWVAGRGDDGSGYQWDVMYDGETGRFLVGHARGNIETPSVSEAALRVALEQAVEIGPAEQTPGSGYMGV